MSSLQQRNFQSGDTIMEQGKRGDSAFMIESGRVEILIEKDNGLVQQVGTRGPGTIIGEMSLIDDEPRTATIKALEDCSLLEINRHEFNRRIEKSDPVMRMVMQVVLTRYRDMLARAAILQNKNSMTKSEELEREYAEKSDAVSAIKMANEFEHALENNELSLHYQPMIDLKTKKVNGFEALMRWHHPEKGDISPGLFIPIAEETGLIAKASLWAFETACKALADFHALGGEYSDLFMSVNFSSEDFINPSLPDILLDTLTKSGLKPHHAHLEITERLLIVHPTSAKDTLEKCRDLGMEISIDDFGTGYSSLSYLHYYPIDILKIDRSFIKNMNDDPTAKELAKSIISLGQNMGMKVIAEGVETIEDATEVAAMGCDTAQGYYFARPNDLETILNFLKSAEFQF
ncbi:MAG: EAL domain-containing protein [Alphaproteobacteria bacterium]|nr:EAL domain-containing protein [Alphaproteobacteria bacterium]